jgi:hypothetical protein
MTRISCMVLRIVTFHQIWIRFTSKSPLLAQGLHSLLQIMPSRSVTLFFSTISTSTAPVIGQVSIQDTLNNPFSVGYTKSQEPKLILNPRQVSSLDLVWTTLVVFA